MKGSVWIYKSTNTDYERIRLDLQINEHRLKHGSSWTRGQHHSESAFLQCRMLPAAAIIMDPYIWSRNIQRESSESRNVAVSACVVVWTKKGTIYNIYIYKVVRAQNGTVNQRRVPWQGARDNGYGPGGGWNRVKVSARSQRSGDFVEQR